MTIHLALHPSPHGRLNELTMTQHEKPLLSTLALSAAALFLGGCKPDPVETAKPTDSTEVAPAAAAGDEMVKCFGINECKGESACNVNKPELGIEHSCAGENDCKGKGWIKVARSECDSKGGEVL